LIENGRRKFFSSLESEGLTIGDACESDRGEAFKVLTMASGTGKNKGLGVGNTSEIRSNEILVCGTIDDGCDNVCVVA
jgi:hypothetical protein